MKQISYLNGFSNHFESEAIPFSLPKGQNSPQKAPFGLYAEQLTGSAFTAPRHRNFKTWMYKIRPSVIQGKFTEIGHPTWFSPGTNAKIVKTPEALRMNPFPLPDQSIPTHFIDSIFTYVVNGNVSAHSGSAIHLFAFNQSMKKSFFYNADAEMMFVLESGEIIIHTELGALELSPLFIGVIPRGIKFKIELKSANARGYLCENFGSPFQQPELGPIGANGLANTRDFETVTADYEDIDSDFELFTRYQGSLWRSELKHSPLDVVAWHGNYAPYRYDLRKFNTIGTVSYDHPDPSIFTVLTSVSTIPGTANLDFVIFPPRYMVAENTFRPPYYHRNVMSEFMGLITGKYDAKEEGFRPAGASLHNCMTSHGPDTFGFIKASEAHLKPEKLENTMAFMWESNQAFHPTLQLLKSKNLIEENYTDCWQSLPKNFK